MGRGRPTAATSVTCPSVAATSNSSRLPARGARSVDSPNEKDPPCLEISDDSSQDSSGRKSRRSLQAVSKEQNANAVTAPNETAKAANVRSRLRKSTQINHNASLNLAEIRTQKSCNYYCSSGTDELLVVNDGVLMQSRAYYGGNSISGDGNHDDADQVANDENVVNVVEISDETDNLSLDTDTMTNESSLVPDSNDATCSADDEAESSAFSDDSQTQSSSIIIVSPEDSNSVQIVEIGQQSDSNLAATATVASPTTVDNAPKIECVENPVNEQNDSSLVTNNLNEQPENVDAPEDNKSHATENDDRIISSPEFFNLPKPKIVRTYQNKRKLRAEALKNQEEPVELESNSKKDDISTELNNSILNVVPKAPVAEKPQEVIECRRSQRQRVIKYEVRELFNIKGSRNSESKNVRSAASSLKSVKNSPRSDVSSSPQTFRGFSDTDDPSSPVNFQVRSLSRLSNATPTPPPLFIAKECVTAAKSNLSDKLANAFDSPDVYDAGNKTLTPGESDISQSSLDSRKSPKNTSKKEGKKPQRVLPRRKTALFNRLSNEIENGIEGEDNATLTPQVNTPPLESPNLNDTTISPQAIKAACDILTETNYNSNPLHSLVSKNDCSSQISKLPLHDSSIQCDLNVATEPNKAGEDNFNAQIDFPEIETNSLQTNYVANILNQQKDQNTSHDIDIINELSNLQPSPEITAPSIDKSVNLKGHVTHSVQIKSPKKIASTKMGEIKVPKKRGRKPKIKQVEEPTTIPFIPSLQYNATTSQMDSNIHTKDAEQHIKTPAAESDKLVFNSVPKPLMSQEQSCNIKQDELQITNTDQVEIQQVENLEALKKCETSNSKIIGNYSNQVVDSNERRENQNASVRQAGTVGPTDTLELIATDAKSPDKKKQTAKRPRTKGEMKQIEENLTQTKKEKFKKPKDSERSSASSSPSSKKKISKIEHVGQSELRKNNAPKLIVAHNQQKDANMLQINSKSSINDDKMINKSKSKMTTDKPSKSSKRSESPVIKMKLNSSIESGMNKEIAVQKSLETLDSKTQQLSSKLNSLKTDTKLIAVEEIDMFASGKKKKLNAATIGSEEKKLSKDTKRLSLSKKKDKLSFAVDSSEVMKKSLFTKGGYESKKDLQAEASTPSKKMKKIKKIDQSISRESTQIKENMLKTASNKSENSAQIASSDVTSSTKRALPDIQTSLNIDSNDRKILEASIKHDSSKEMKKSSYKRISFCKNDKDDDSSSTSSRSAHSKDLIKKKQLDPKLKNKAKIKNDLDLSDLKNRIESKTKSFEKYPKLQGFSKSLKQSRKEGKTTDEKKSRRKQKNSDSSLIDRANNVNVSSVKKAELKINSKGSLNKSRDTSVEKYPKLEIQEPEIPSTIRCKSPENTEESHRRIEEMLKALDSMHSPVSAESNATQGSSPAKNCLEEIENNLEKTQNETNSPSDVLESLITKPITDATQLPTNTSISLDATKQQKLDETPPPVVLDKLENVNCSFKKDESYGEKITFKKRKERSFSKTLSTSDGISDHYSSDSNDSRQSTEIKNSWNTEADLSFNEKETSKKLPEETSDQSVPLVSNITSVLNGLSSDVMNDLLQWTCNNKQAVLQIKDSIDLNQKVNLSLKNLTESTTKFDEGQNISPLNVNDIKNDVPEKIAPIENPPINNTTIEVKSNGTPAEEKPADGEVEEAPKESAVIQTSKDMLAELMNNSFDADTDVCSESSESSSKPEPESKKEFPQTIKILPQASNGDASTKSSDSDQTDQNSQDSSSLNIRRSHRIKTQTKSSVVGRGLVRDKLDRSQNNSNAIDLEVQNAKFLKDMEERLSQFQMIKENEYRCERVISKEAKKMSCDCFLTRDEEDRGELGCGEDCLNRLLMIECSSNCPVGERCTNRRFQKNHYAPCKVFRTEKKGFGILSDAEIPSGQFVMEYVGEVLNGKQFEKRAALYSQDKNKHYYFMALRGDSIIDATMKGNISRFINHSCDPNAETQKWTVNGELRIGFFSKRRISPGEEITFDYQFQRYGKEAQKCYCESVNCRGWIGEEPETEDEEEVTSSESEEESEVKMPEANKDLKLDSEEILKEGVSVTDQQDIVDPEKIAPEAEALLKPLEKIIEKTPAQKQLEKDKSARKALKAAERFAKIAAKMKAKKERELIKRQTRMAMEDPDLEAQICSLEKIGLKNQPLTLQLSRCMVRAKYMQSKLRILSILQKGEVACRRLFLDYHGLRLLHGWMSEIETTDIEQELNFRLQTLTALEVLPIPNKTMLKESKVFQVVDSWCNEIDQPLTSSTDVEPDDQQSAKRQKTDIRGHQDTRDNIKSIARKLTTAWELLPEVFRIPKKERIEQMKEHEREADRLYKTLNVGDEDQYKNELRNKERFGAKKSYKWVNDKFDKRKELAVKGVEKVNSAEANLTKMQRRQLFAAKVAKDEAEKRLAEIRREFEFKCKFYGLDPRYMTPNAMPFCVHPPTGQWYSKEKLKIPTPPSHSHIKVPSKLQSTDPKDYKMPEMDLPPMWKFAMDPRGRLYFYHIKIRIPQWEPPIKILPLTNDAATDGSAPTVANPVREPSTSTIEPQPSTSKQALAADAGASNTDTEETDSDISCSEIIGSKKGVPLKIGKEMIQELKRNRKRKRFNRLVQERTISPRREEDRLYNQIEMRKYRENKEKIRRRKEEIKRRRALLKKEEEIEPNAGSKENNTSQPSNSEAEPADNLSLPIQDYLLSSDEELEKPDYDISLIEKIVHSDKIVDELDAIAKERPLKRPIPFVKDHSELKKRIKLEEKKRPESIKSEKPIKVRKSEVVSNKKVSTRAKEKFRSDIAGIIVHHLTPYRRDSCPVGKITNNEDFKHLARKLTHFVLLKELKHCDLTGQTLIVTESVKNKSREFIKKYMAKYGHVYVKPANDPEFREIPH